MKKGEKMLLIGTVGLGALLAATQLPTKGRKQALPLRPAPVSPTASAEAELAPRSTLELLATRRLELKPLPPHMRNPFRPSPGTSKTHVGAPGARGVRDIGAENVAALRLTGILGEEPHLTALINGRAVRAGDVIGGLTVLRVTKRGVLFELHGERFFKTMHKELRGSRGSEGSEPDADATEAENLEPVDR